MGPTTSATPGRKAEYRIDDLAREAGTTVRNVRAYQERGLLPPPRREGRAGLFDESHLERLRLIGQLLHRGYTLANIGELLAAWDNGHAIEELIGVWPEDGSPLAGQDIPRHVTPEWLAVVFGPFVPAHELPQAFESALQLGILEPDGDRFRVTDPRLLRAAAELVAAGVPLRALAAHARILREDVERIASRFLDLVAENVFEPRAQVLPNPEEAARLAEIALRLRPLADMVVLAELGRTMERQTARRLQDHIARLLTG